MAQKYFRKAASGVFGTLKVDKDTVYKYVTYTSKYFNPISVYSGRDVIPLTLESESFVSELAYGYRLSPKMKGYKEISPTKGVMKLERVYGCTLWDFMYCSVNPNLLIKVYSNLQELSQTLYEFPWNHNDLHKSNLMVTVKGRVYIIDWGLSEEKNEFNDDYSDSERLDRYADQVYKKWLRVRG